MNNFNVNQNPSHLHIILIAAKHFLMWMGYIYLLIPLFLNIQFVFKCLNFINSTVISILKVKSLCTFTVLFKYNC